MKRIYLIGAEGSLPSAREDAVIIPVAVEDWNSCLSPWPAEKLSFGGAFTGHAAETLEKLKRLIRDTEGDTGEPSLRGIAGYSLAGLFSLWAAAESGLFRCAASVSGSLWFDGWREYLSASVLPSALRFVYLSVGDREAHTRDPRLARVEENTVFTRDRLTEKGKACYMELNPGGHFRDPSLRVQKAVDALIHAMNGLSSEGPV